MTGSNKAANRPALPGMSLVLGGARSGKSRFAERLVRLAGIPCTYLATAEPSDQEMQARIARHRADRGTAAWIVIEAPQDLAGAIAGLGPPSCAALIDCATLWLSNRLLAGADSEAAAAALIEALVAAPMPVVVVSNEVGWSPVPLTPLGRAFRDAQGRLNQRLAERAGLVVGIIAGLPMVLKGRLPPGIAHAG